MDIGIELSLNKSDLDALEGTNGGDVGKCFTETISLWLNKTDPLPSLCALVAALKEPAVGLEHLADQLEKKWREKNAAKSETFISDAETDQISFPHISKVAPDEETRQLLEGRLREESLDIMQDFQVVINKFFDTLEDQDYPVKRLKRYLAGSIKNKQEQLETMEEIQAFIKCRSSFFDHRLVKYMITMAGSDEDKERLQKYEQAFLCYAKRRIYECPSKFKAICTPDDIEMHVKLDSEYDECKLEELQGFQNRLSSVLQINVYYCLLSEVKEGCFELTFSIPQHVQEATFPLSSEQLVELEQLKVLYIACGDYKQLIAPRPPESVRHCMFQCDYHALCYKDYAIQLPSEENSGDDDLDDSLAIYKNAAPTVSSFEPPRRPLFRSLRRRHTGRSDASSCASGSVYAYGSGIESGVRIKILV